MNRETNPKGEKYLSGTLGEVYAECYEKQKDDSKRIICVREVGKCEHEGKCFIKLQRAINQRFIADPELVCAELEFNTDKKKYVSRINSKTLIHDVFEVKPDIYTPVEESDEKL